MRPVDDWMEVKLLDKQMAKMDVRLVMPDTVDVTKDESAVYEVLAVGPGYVSPINGQLLAPCVRTGDKIVMVGYSSIMTFKLPNGRRTLVGQARNVAFVIEDKDLEGGT